MHAHDTQEVPQEVQEVHKEVHILRHLLHEHVLWLQGKRIEIKNLTERDSFRKDFLGNVSHELKTPLFTVQGYILTLIEGGINDKLIRDK